jgi:membrane protease YdiL (CAAX protease family)
MIKNIRGIIQKEKIYVWMLIFIIWLNIFNLISNILSGKVLVRAKEKSKIEEVAPAYKRLSDLKQAQLKSILENNMTLTKLLGFLSLIFIAVISIGIILDFKFILLKLQGKNILHTLSPPLRTNWQILDVIKIIILFLFSGYLVSVGEYMIFNLMPYKEIDKNLFMVVNTSIMDVLVLVFLFYFITKKYKQKLSSIGLSLKNFSSHLLLGLKSYITIIPIILIVLFMIIWLSNLFNYQPPRQPIFDLFFQEDSPPLVIYLSIFVTLLGPIVEEIFFRGFAYRALRERLGIFKAIAITSLAFAALHTNLAGFVPILILGVLLAYLAERTNSIIPSITVHVIHNTAILSFIFLSKRILEIIS